MLRFLVTLWIGVWAGLPGFAQASGSADKRTLDVYPVRVNHKVGYIKIYNRPEGAYVHTVIPPRYDYVMDENIPYNSTSTDRGEHSPYRLFEIDEKVGLLDQSLQEVLPPRYHRIRVLTPALFAVEEEEDALFKLIDSSGREFLEGERYEDICLAAGTTKEQQQFFFLVKRNGFWGMRGLAGPLRLPHQFTDIIPAETIGYFKVRTANGKGLWQIIDANGNWVVQSAFEDIMVLSPIFFAAQTGQQWNILQPKRGGGHEAGGARYRHVEKLNESLAVFVTHANISDSVILWRIAPRPTKLSAHVIPANEGKSTMQTVAELKSRKAILRSTWFFPLDDKYALHWQSGGVFTLIDSAGRKASEEFDMIIPSGAPYAYRVLREGKWGILQPARKSGLAFPCQFDAISDFRDLLAVSKDGNGFGILALRDTQSAQLPCIHQSATLFGGNKAQLQMENLVFDLTYTPEQGFSQEIISTNAVLVSANADFNFREALPAPRLPSPRYKPATQLSDRLLLRSEPGGFAIVKPNPLAEYLRENEADSILWREPIPDKRRPLRASEIVADEMLAIFYQDTGYVSPLAPPGRGETKALTRFYSKEKKAFVDEAQMLGFRPFDSIYTYTAFLDTAGLMGLIDRQGRQLESAGKPVRFTYIGPFVAGRARVCSGGVLAADFKGQIQESLKFEISLHSEFLSDFQVFPEKHKALTGMEKVRIFATGTHENPLRWGYIDTKGDLVTPIDADYVLDYYWQDSLALFLKKNNRTYLGKPDADYGMLDYEGKVIAPAIFSAVANMPDFFLVNVDSTPTFYFTQKGVQLFVNPTRLRPFSEGLAQYLDPQTRLWGYIDSLGNIAISPRFIQARPFSEGRALVADTSGVCVFIDAAGQTVFSTGKPAKGHQFIGDFKYGRCWFKENGWAWGCYDRKGNIAIPPKFFYQPQGAALQPLPPDTINPLPLDFSHGIAVAASIIKGKTTYHLIDTLGEILATFDAFRHIGRLNLWGLAICADNNNQKGLINFRGELVLPPRYSEIGGFINGYAKVKRSTGKWGLINLEGREVLPAAFAAIDTVSEGLVAVRNIDRGPWFVIDTFNRLQIKHPFDQVAPFKKGVSLVSTNSGTKGINRFGEELHQLKGTMPLFFSENFLGVEDQSNNRMGRYYADASGSNVFGRYYQEVSPFRLGVAKVKRMDSGNRNEAYGAINKRGVMVVPPKFRNLHIQPDGNIITNPQRFYGVVDKKGTILIPPDFDLIVQYEDRALFRVERGEAIGYIRVANGKAEWVWELQK